MGRFNGSGLSWAKRLAQELRIRIKNNVLDLRNMEISLVEMFRLFGSCYFNAKTKPLACLDTER